MLFIPHPCQNATTGLDCSQFPDPECYFSCPARCVAAVQQGRTDPSCAKYASYIPDCYVAPCPQVGITPQARVTACCRSAGTRWT